MFFRLTEREGVFALDDSKIIELYWARDESALTETDRKYGNYCWKIAHNILLSPEDAEECVSDTWLRAWDSMPPQKPAILSAFLAKITRNLSIDRYKSAHADKRGGGRVAVCLDELCDCISTDTGSAERTLEEQELASVIDRFLRTLSERDCSIFLRRYWYVDSVASIARRYRVPENNIKSNLFRTRNKLRKFLQEEGFAV